MLLLTGPNSVSLSCRLMHGRGPRVGVVAQRRRGRGVRDRRIAPRSEALSQTADRHHQAPGQAETSCSKLVNKSPRETFAVSHHPAARVGRVDERLGRQVPRLLQAAAAASDHHQTTKASMPTLHITPLKIETHATIQGLTRSDGGGRSKSVFFWSTGRSRVCVNDRDAGGRRECRKMQ